MKTHIDQAALDAASAGANRLSADRLRAAAEYVVERTKPGQLILFGSAARGEFGDESDFDFAVVRPGSGGGARMEHKDWDYEAAGTEIDALFIDAAELKANRWMAGTVHCSILSEGKTIFRSRGARQIETIRDAGGELADIAVLVKQGRYNTAWAQEIAGRARAHLTGAARDWEAACEEDACTRLRKAGLYALKGVIAANGSPAVHGRDLTDLWNRAEALDGGINVPRDDWKLKGLSRYADAARETLVGARRGARIYRGVRRTIEALVEHAEKMALRAAAGRRNDEAEADA